MKIECGSTDTTSGEPCEKPAGWGTDNEAGPCVHHLKHFSIDKHYEEVPPAVPDQLEEYWQVIIRWLKRNNVMTIGNYWMAQAACCTFADWLRNRKTIESNDLIRYDQNNQRESKHPSFQINRDAINQLRRLLNTMGLTTKSMQQITFPEPKREKTKMDRVLDNNPRNNG